MVSTIPVASLGPLELASYAVLFLGVAASWTGIPVVGGAALAAAGALAGDGKLNVWVAVVVAALASWTGGYVGYLLGARAGHAIAGRPGRWQRQRQRAVDLGERFYRRWGPLAVFLTPTWVAGAMQMPRKSFLAWNAIAAIVSSLAAVFGAYAIASAVLGKLSTSRGLIALVAIGAVVAAVGITHWRRRTRRDGDERRTTRPTC